MRVSFLAVTTRAGTPLLHPTSLQLPAQHPLAVVGPSGGGKSTFLAALAGLSPHQVRGEVTWDKSPARIALAIQDPDQAFTPYRRLASQLRDCPALRQGPTGLLLQVLGELGLPDEALLRRYPHELSVGMRKRVLLAAILAARPDAALFDEPTAGIDPSLRWRVVETLVKHSKQLVVATHDESLVKRLPGAALLRVADGHARLAARSRGGGAI